MNYDRPTIGEIVLAEDPSAWRSVGFSVDDNGVCRVGTVTIRLTGTEAGDGFLSWSLRHIPPSGDIDGMTTEVETREPLTPDTHECGATSIDHIVWLTPDGERTTTAVTRVTFLPVRRIRETSVRDQPMTQRFFRLGEVILEVVSSEPPGSGPVKFFGLAFTVSDLDGLAVRFGDTLGPIQDAVQPGRRVATLRGRDIGISVPILFMSPEP